VGQHPDLMLSAKRDGKAARFFRKMLQGAEHTRQPRVVTVKRNAAHPPAMETPESEIQTARKRRCGELRGRAAFKTTESEQDHRNIVTGKLMMGLKVLFNMYWCFTWIA